MGLPAFPTRQCTVIFFPALRAESTGAAIGTEARKAAGAVVLARTALAADTPPADTSAPLRTANARTDRAFGA